MKTPIKGRPFSSLSDDKLDSYMKMFQEFCYAYKTSEYKSQRGAVELIWKDLSNEHLERVSEDALKALDKPKKSPKISISGASGKKTLKKFKKSVDKRKKV